MLPNPCFVWISPVFGTTSKYPSVTFHFAGPPSLVLTHADKSLPSKSTVASEGALPAASCDDHVPGSITFGAGRFRSCAFHCVCHAAAPQASTSTAAPHRPHRLFIPVLRSNRATLASNIIAPRQNFTRTNLARLIASSHERRSKTNRAIPTISHTATT